jgi:hypothetical protein
MAKAKDKLLHLLGEALRDGSFVKLTLGAHRGGDRSLKQVFVRRAQLRQGPRLSFVWRYATRDVTKNFPEDEAISLLADIVGREFHSAHLFTTRLTAQLEFHEGGVARLVESKPVHTDAPSASHDRSRRRLVDPHSPWLHALGVTTSDGNVAKGMEPKFKQINKFVEVLMHLLDEACGGQREDTHDSQSAIRNPQSAIELLDMGCGKGYLTFAVCEWLLQTDWSATIRGVEARAELVELCNRVARENNFSRLRFETGDIASTLVGTADVLIALHACDTATDDAIAKGVAAGAKVIVVSPCCHKELRPRIQPPPALAGALRQGILLERHAEFVTDALRAALLEWAGYSTKVFEFVSTGHTAKNLMIAAVRRAAPADRAAAQLRARQLAAFYGVQSQRLADQLGFSLTETAPNSV